MEQTVYDLADENGVIHATNFVLRDSDTVSVIDGAVHARNFVLGDSNEVVVTDEGIVIARNFSMADADS